MVKVFRTFTQKGEMNGRGFTIGRMARRGAREALRIAWLAPLIVAAGGCVLIPTSTDTASTEVIGKRTDADGRVCEKIIRYDKHLNFQYFGITPEGLYGSHYFSYSRYAAITGEGESPIWAMEHFPSLAWTDVKTAVPIPDSDRWITFERSGCTIDEYDICLIIFSVKEGKILRHRFEHVRRYAPPGVPSVIGGFWIEGRDDLRYLLVHETDKITRVDTVTGDMTVEEETAP